ncbi:MAG: hypothetical protein LBL49_02995 [Clostridiales Family XIII bacterium]|jgi:hypothetical protein|nr:hypothetical protein [Clostridiales Family XIII bacterium]
MLKKIMSIVFTLCLVFCFGGTVYGDDVNTQDSGVEISDSTLDEIADSIEEYSFIEDGNITTVTTYLLSDGTEIIDEFTRSFIQPFATGTTHYTSGNFTRTITGWATMTLSANFTYEDNTLPTPDRVICTSVSGSCTPASGKTLDSYEKTKSSDWVSIGKAYANAHFKLYTTGMGTLDGYYGDFKINCDDQGNVTVSLSSN